MGSHLTPKSEWLVAMMMLGDQVVALNPWTKRERKVKQFRSITLPYGMVWQQFCNVQSPGFFRHTMKLPQGFDTAASIVLPMPNEVSSKRLGLKSPSMQCVKQEMEKILLDGEHSPAADDEREDNKVITHNNCMRVLLLHTTNDHD